MCGQRPGSGAGELRRGKVAGPGLQLMESLASVDLVRICQT